ncbi:MAG TPA: peptidyl-prolyl cis-trans isomerase [Chthonomonadaceae bacterium]|nr:peptidyl-prolyl cis-trans isomerase [Chthonomonadaceae bacterium]
MRRSGQGAQRKIAWWLGVIGGAWLLAAFAGGIPARAQTGADKIAAWVNGEYITEAEFYRRLQNVRAQDFIVSLNPPVFKGDTAGQLVLNALINERLILQWAAKTNQLPTEAQVTADLEKLKKQPAIAQALENKLLSEDTLKFQIKVERARYNLATTAASISPAETEAYYKAHIANYTVPERWGLAAIRTSNPETLNKIEADLKAGKPFAEVARAYSEDEKSKANGGMLGVVSANDSNLPAPLREVIKKLKVGEVSSPVRFDLKDAQGKPRGTLWFIVRLVSREPQIVHPFSEVKEDVERAALLERAGGYAVADKKIQQFRETSDIKINLPGYQSLLSPPKKS